MELGQSSASLKGTKQNAWEGKTGNLAKISILLKEDMAKEKKKEKSKISALKCKIPVQTLGTNNAKTLLFNWLHVFFVHMITGWPPGVNAEG